MTDPLDLPHIERIAVAATRAHYQIEPFPGVRKDMTEILLVPFAGNGSASSVSVSRSHHARCSVPNMRRNFQLAVLALRRVAPTLRGHGAG